MKRSFKRLVVWVIIVMSVFTLAACGPFEGFDDDSVIASSDSFSTVASVTSQTGSKYTFKCSKCNGVEKIKSITVPENPVFDMTLSIESGRFKVVLVSGNSVFVIADSNTEDPVSVELAAGTYDLKMVGEDAKVNFTFNFNNYA